MVLNRRGLYRAMSPRKSPRRPGSAGRLNRISMQEISRSVELATQLRNNIQVVVRVRPTNEREETNREREVVQVVDDHMLVFDPKLNEEDFYYHGVKQKGRDFLKKSCKEVKFAFDLVFDPSARNEGVFEGTTKGIVNNVIEGYNCSVFAYGATGAGKTYTMLGNGANPGIIFYTVQQLYQRIDELKQEKSFEVSVSYLEIYNETVQDLLHPSGSLMVREDGQGLIAVPGLTLHKPEGAQQLLELLASGNKNRTQHPTDLNAESSRSHAVFQVHVNQRDRAAGLSANVRVAKLSMIDLAGSERGTATGLKGMRFREGSNINKSLLALGNCINALADGRKHIPYRNSKLTRLLKDSLGGNCRTVMIANVSPAVSSYDDTYNTLKYADRAKNIKINVKKNVVSVNFHVTQYAKIVEELKAEIDELKVKLQACEEQKREEFELVALGRRQPTDRDLELENEIPALYEEYGQLRYHLLDMESQEKKLQLKIKLKQLSLERLQVITLAGSQRERSTMRMSRVIQVLEERLLEATQKRESAEKAVAEAQLRLTALQTKAEFVQNDGEEPWPAHKVAIETSRIKVEKQDFLQHEDHMEQMNALQAQELSRIHGLLAQALLVAHKYHVVLKGNKMLPPHMEEEFQALLAQMESPKEVSWADNFGEREQMGIDKNDPYSMADLLNLNVEKPSMPFANVKRAIPSLQEHYEVEEAVDRNEKKAVGLCHPPGILMSSFPPPSSIVACSIPSKSVSFPMFKFSAPVKRTCPTPPKRNRSPPPERNTFSPPKMDLEEKSITALVKLPAFHHGTPPVAFNEAKAVSPPKSSDELEQTEDATGTFAESLTLHAGSTPVKTSQEKDSAEDEMEVVPPISSVVKCLDATFVMSSSDGGEVGNEVEDEDCVFACENAESEVPIDSPQEDMVQKAEPAATGKIWAVPELKIVNGQLSLEVASDCIPEEKKGSPRETSTVVPAGRTFAEVLKADSPPKTQEARPKNKENSNPRFKPTEYKKPKTAPIIPASATRLPVGRSNSTAALNSAGNSVKKMKFSRSYGRLPQGDSRPTGIVKSPLREVQGGGAVQRPAYMASTKASKLRLQQSLQSLESRR